MDKKKKKHLKKAGDKMIVKKAIKHPPNKKTSLSLEFIKNLEEFTSKHKEMLKKLSK